MCSELMERMTFPICDLCAEEPFVSETGSTKKLNNIKIVNYAERP